MQNLVFMVLTADTISDNRILIDTRYLPPLDYHDAMQQANNFIHSTKFNEARDPLHCLIPEK